MLKTYRAWLVGVAVVAAAALGVGCPGENSTPDAGTQKLKVAFVYLTTPGDIGWTYAHELGRQEAAAFFGDKAELTYKDNVPEGDEAVPVIDELVAAGNKLIFTTSFGYMDPTLTAAGKYPEVKFEHCSGYKTAANMSNYFGRMYQARYLSGIVAGRATANGKIGYVAAFPIPEVIRMMDAFTLGVRSVNPTATVQVEWTKTWYDPALEGAAAQKLLDAGCDVLAQHQDSTATIEKAKAAGKHAIGYNADMVPVDPATVLTTPIWHWSVYYKKSIQSVLDGSWKSQSWWGGMDTGIVDIGPYGTAAVLTQAVKDEVAAKKKEIVDGTFDVFWGGANGIKKQDGTVLVAPGAKMADADMLNLMDLVDGVVGTIPPS